ncbi:MAG: metallophosphoesterase, partial [Opitutales bacterium]|nr:metallophosphoesterase [Opitutales bacterium]
MKVYALADLHLSFREKFAVNNLDKIKTAKPMDKFGDNWIKHYLKIWWNWSTTVKDEDIVLVPGDISWALRLEEALWDLDFIEKLPGRKILGKGNHDYWWKKKKKISEVISDKIDILQN